MSAKKVDLRAIKVELSAKNVDLSGKKVYLSAKKVNLSAKKVNSGAQRFHLRTNLSTMFVFKYVRGPFKTCHDCCKLLTKVIKKESLS